MTTREEFILVIKDYLDITEEVGHNWDNQDKAEYIAGCCEVWEINAKEWSDE